MSLPPFPRTRRALRAVTVAGLVAGGIAGAALATAGASEAAAAVSHNPIGHLRAASAVTGGIRITGWAVDPGDPTRNVKVFGVVAGRHDSGTAVTSVAAPKVSSKYHAGPTPAFSLTVPVTGMHTVCVVAQRQRGTDGVNSVLGCVAVPLGRTMSAARLARHDPRGAIRYTSTSSHRIYLSGWATDPDYVGHHSTVVLYVDGVATATDVTTTTPSPVPAGAGPRSYFRFLEPVTRGSHVACVWARNVGFGSRTFLGCRTMDTRGAAGTGALPAEPTLNAAALKTAEKQIGKNYVWGATGPKTFDCSGLVVYSYGKAGYTTPRTAAQQYAAARVIPASRALPGDLVFYHDDFGNVYHVGIYVSPGHTVAAIDTQEGVDWQNVWDPSSTSYGSFTHT